MLRNTFCHLPRVGETTEKKLWKNQITTWDEFINAPDAPGIGTNKKLRLNEQLQEAKKQLLARNASYFTQLPSQQHWRVWEEFQNQAAFIDIETNYQQQITVLGISDGERVWQFVRHHNLDEKKVAEVLKQFNVLVTFNGACFDLPIIKRYFKHAVPNVPHIDLRFAGARAGLSGGLKSIEKELGIDRGEDLDGVSGADALVLWSQYRKTGEQKFKEILLDYNAQDVLNLRHLTNTIYERLSKEHKKAINTRAPSIHT